LETAKDIQHCLALRKKYLYQPKVTRHPSRSSSLRRFFPLFFDLMLLPIADSVALFSRLHFRVTPVSGDPVGL
jgi:hypothetical protein